MSHFLVLVIGDKFEEQLAPYDANIERPERQVTCFCATEQGRQFYAEDPGLRCDECNGTGVTTIPNQLSKWDWYVMGGRWLGNLKLKLGRKGSLGEPGVDRNSPKFDCDQARKGDIDFEGMLDACRQEAERIWQEAEGKDELRRRLLFGVDGGETREQFIARNSVPLNVHAVVKNGKWFEYGEMGWFGVSINEKEVKDWQGELRDLLADVSDDTLLTVVDCHI